MQLKVSVKVMSEAKQARSLRTFVNKIKNRKYKKNGYV